MFSSASKTKGTFSRTNRPTKTERPAVMACTNYGLKPVWADDQYDPEQLAMGAQVELEHTNNPALAKCIAKHHLMEIPDYYTRLKAMEAAAGVKETELEM